MRRMIALLIIMQILAVCGCQKQMLGIPQYPLNYDVVDEIQKEYNLSFSIVQDDQIAKIRPERTSYNFYNEKGEHYGSVASEERNNARGIFLSLPQDGDVSKGTPVNGSENFIAFATKLFGGFESDKQVYKEFINAYKKQTLIDTEQGYSYWETEIWDIYCKITIWDDSTTETSNVYLRTIEFVSDRDVFYEN